jgi:aspartyl-tRNA(Asn)/glutamyl-tRNA(Gln) amidotransferase subunit C
MTVKKEDVKHIARLSKLRLNEKEIEEFTEDMNQILDYVKKLEKIDTSKVEPLSHPLEGVNVFREDKLQKSIDREAALKNAPERTEEFFKVPKVIKVDKR